MNEEKTTILKMTTDQIESKFGKGSIMNLEIAAKTSLSRPSQLVHLHLTQPSASGAFPVGAS